MHKYYRIILSLTLVSFVMSQQEPVCNDREYNKLKTKISNDGAESLTEREWEYYKLKDNQCLELKNREETKKRAFGEGGLNFWELAGCMVIIVLFSPF